MNNNSIGKMIGSVAMSAVIGYGIRTLLNKGVKSVPQNVNMNNVANSVGNNVNNFVNGFKDQMKR